MTEEKVPARVKVVTLRLPQDEAGRIEFLARVEGISMNDIVRRALDHYATALKADDEFVGRARALLARDNEIANQLV